MHTKTGIRTWIAGARLNTIPTALTPVIAGSGAASWSAELSWFKAFLALIVSISLTIGVNYANDYSDGIRGTDNDRQGPLRLVGSGLVHPRTVLIAAFIAFGIAGVAGMVLALMTSPWLIALGGVCILGAWWYTGGSHPYGYSGFGEIAVFIFFGLIGVCGTQYTQIGRIDWIGLCLAFCVGCLSTAVLVANNLRDIPTDIQTGKITLAVKLGDHKTRLLFSGLIIAVFLVNVALVWVTPWCLLGLLIIPLAINAMRPVFKGETGQRLIPVLRRTGVAALLWSTLIAAVLYFTSSIL